ncbi:helix-turn-helix transcriptional regulator [Cytobacillus sp. Hm23]
MQNKSSSTRDEILRLLKFKKRLTVIELANELGITEMAVRRHLNTLERDLYIQSTLVRQAIGRPIHVYQLSAKGEELFPRNYKSVTLEFLEDIHKMGGQEMIHQLFQNRLERLTKRYDTRLNNKTFEEKINELASIQNENGYMAEIEQKDDDVFYINEFNCPISEVAEHYEQACACELQLFKDVLKTDVIACSCLAKGDDYCRYEVKKPSENIKK